jgi:hypothetical protein
MVMMLVLSASAAFAGEAKGPPGPDGATGGKTPIKALQSEETPAGPANSICAFSGLNDVIEDAEPTQTQSYGTFLVEFGKDFVDTEIGPPGVNCKGFPTFPAP